MEYMVLAVVLGLFVLFVFLKEYFVSRGQNKKRIQSYYDEFGVWKEREYPAERYERIASYYKKHQKAGQIDDITWNDLNMDDLFKRMNFTCSAAGEEYLYYTLRDITKSPKDLDHLEELVRFFTEQAEERVKIQILMQKLGYTGKFSLYDYLDHLDYLGERSNQKAVICNILFGLSFLLLPFQTGLAMLVISILVAHNIVTYYREKGEVEPYLISFVYVVRLLTVCEELARLELPACKQEIERIRENYQKIKDLKKTAKWLFWWNRGESGNPLAIFFDYLRILFHIDLIQFNKMLKQLRFHIEEVDTLIGQVGQLETAISIGAFRLSLEEGYCVPDFEEAQADGAEANQNTETKADAEANQNTEINKNAKAARLEILAGYHPLLKHPVKNSIRTEQGVLLTGSNASGKSTFLKMVALNAILAQTIHTCTAQSYRGDWFQVISSMSLKDDIEHGESYYIVEIKALKRILQAGRDGGSCVLCFVDEVLRGTNTVERIAAATQILRSLAEGNFLCFAATHDIELTGLLEDLYQNYHFEEEIREGDILFPYQLMQGKAVTRNAIKLLEIMGYDRRIVQEAESMADRFVKSGVWK